jgi:hypothetical protein
LKWKKRGCSVVAMSPELARLIAQARNRLEGIPLAPDDTHNSEIDELRGRLLVRLDMALRLELTLGSSAYVWDGARPALQFEVDEKKFVLAWVRDHYELETPTDAKPIKLVDDNFLQDRLLIAVGNVIDRA